jgi:hypothetical protein
MNRSQFDLIPGGLESVDVEEREDGVCTTDDS